MIQVSKFRSKKKFKMCLCADAHAPCMPCLFNLILCLLYVFMGILQLKTLLAWRWNVRLYCMSCFGDKMSVDICNHTHNAC